MVAGEGVGLDKLVHRPAQVVTFCEPTPYLLDTYPCNRRIGTACKMLNATTNIQQPAQQPAPEGLFPERPAEAPLPHKQA